LLLKKKSERVKHFENPLRQSESILNLKNGGKRGITAHQKKTTTPMKAYTTRRV
jgi:hypothetical protein